MNKNEVAIEIAIDKMEEEAINFIKTTNSKSQEEAEDNIIEKYGVEAWPMILVGIVSAVTQYMKERWDV